MGGSRVAVILTLVLTSVTLLLKFFYNNVISLHVTLFVTFLIASVFILFLLKNYSLFLEKQIASIPSNLKQGNIYFLVMVCLFWTFLIISFLYIFNFLNLIVFYYRELLHFIRWLIRIIIF